MNGSGTEDNIAARAFGEYLSHTHPENRNGSAHLLCETSVGLDQESDATGPKNNNNHLGSSAEGSEAALSPAC
ncbi:hypothetical protein WMY93_020954 [Mugilogobius chulae]|uniref:Uncharacterized protein n=1 Tax=Mugilogobius chulae TaxID=88201 RepID=A0AAW0NKJ3_9GOBI